MGEIKIYLWKNNEKEVYIVGFVNPFTGVQGSRSLGRIVGLNLERAEKIKKDLYNLLNNNESSGEIDPVALDIYERCKKSSNNEFSKSSKAITKLKSQIFNTTNLDELEFLRDNIYLISELVEAKITLEFNR